MKKLLLFFTLLAMAIPLQAYGISALWPSHEGGYVNAYNDVAIKADYKIFIENAPAGGGIVKMDDQVTIIDNNNYANAGTNVTVTLSPNWGWKANGITVTDANGRNVTVTDNGDGSYSFVMPASDITVLAGYKRLVGYIFEVVTREPYIVEGQTYLIVPQDRGKVMAYKKPEDISYPVTDFEYVQWVGYMRSPIKVDDNACMFTMDNLKDTIVDSHPFKVAWLNTGNGFISESEAEDGNLDNFINRTDNGRAIIQSLNHAEQHDAMEMRFRNRLLKDSIMRYPISYDYSGDQLIKVRFDNNRERVWLYQLAPYYNIATECNPSGSGFISLVSGIIDDNSQQGMTVQFHVGTYHGWRIGQVCVTNNATGEAIAVITENIANDGSDYSFVMPAGDVTIRAEFIESEPDLYLLGTVMNRTNWCASGPRFDYDIVNEQYFLDVYFKGTGDHGTDNPGNDDAYGHFSLAMGVDPNITWQTAGANEGDWNQYVTGVLAPAADESLVQGGDTDIQLYNDRPGNAFKIPAGVYRITVNQHRTKMNIERKPLHLTFDPVSGSLVALGQVVTIDSDLEEIVHNIASQHDINDERPQSFRNTIYGTNIKDNDNTALINKTGTTIVQGEAWIGQIVVSADAEYTIGEPSAYDIKTVCDPKSGGTITLTGTAADGNELGGRTVVMTVDANMGYSLNSVTAVVSGTNETLDVTPNGNGTYSFVMPEGNVTVTAHYQLVGIIFKLVNDTTEIVEGEYYTLVNLKDEQVLNSISPDADSNHYSSTDVLGFASDWDSGDFSHVILDGNACFFSIEDLSVDYYSYRTGYLKTAGGYLGLDSINSEFGYLSLFDSRDDVKKFTLNLPYFLDPTDIQAYYDYQGGNSSSYWEIGYESSVGFMMDNRFGIHYSENFLYRPAVCFNITTVVSSSGTGSLELSGGVVGTNSAEGCPVTVIPVAQDGYTIADLVVTKDGTDGETVEVTRNLDGTYTFIMPGCDVTVTGNFETGYKISKECIPPEGGVIIVAPNVREGDTVEFAVVPNNFYEFIDVVVTANGAGGQVIPITLVDDIYSFIMPAKNVTITATFEEILTSLQFIESPFEPLGDGDQVKVSDELIGAWAARNYLWAKDVAPAKRSNFYLEKSDDGNIVDFQRDVAELQYRDWEQSNWVMLDFSTIPELKRYSEKQLMTVMKKYVDQRIEGGSISGEYNCEPSYDVFGIYGNQEIKIRHIIRLDALPTIVKPATTGPGNSLGYPGFRNDQMERPQPMGYYSDPAASYAYNHYAPNNFIVENAYPDGISYEDEEEYDEPFDDVRYFFMRPKDQEIVHVWGVWLGELDYHDATIGEDRTDEVFGVYDNNPYELRGAFRIASWDYNVNKVDRNGDPVGYGYPNDDLVPGDVYSFHAAVQYSPILGGGEPQKSPKRAVDWDDEYTIWLNTPEYYDVYPLDMVGSPQEYTNVKELLPHDAITIESIRYYNIMGQESMTPFDGINIEVIRYKDGSMISHKVLK